MGLRFMSLRKNRNLNQSKANKQHNKNNNPINELLSHHEGESTTSEARRITDTLLRTRKLMKRELERVSDVTDVLNEDEALLGSTKDTHLQLKYTGKGAKSALRSLKTTENWDSIVLWSAVVFYMIVSLWVL